MGFGQGGGGPSSEGSEGMRSFVVVVVVEGAGFGDGRGVGVVSGPVAARLGRVEVRVVEGF